jgi:hypothetical protein
MGFLDIELARTIDEDRRRVSQGYHRIDKALAARQKSSASLVPNLAHWLRGVMKRERRIAIEEDNHIAPLPQASGR